MGECTSKLCQCHFCRCCEWGPKCSCCIFCRKWFGDWWMCSDCCEDFEEDGEMIISNGKFKSNKEKPDEGEGMYQYENGDFYVGEWRRGKRHGYGSLEKKDGSRVVGFFYEDEYVGEKPDERLRRSPVTSRPFSKRQNNEEEDDSTLVRKSDQEKIEKAREEESSRDRLLNRDNSQTYDSVQK